MRKFDQHTNQSEDDFDKYFPPVDLHFNKSREEVWAQLSMNLEHRLVPSPKPKRNLKAVLFYAAASLALLLSIVSFLKFYSVSKIALPGQHLVVILPDGSNVELNAASKLSYHPYWFTYSRNLNLEGEAFFKVHPGSRFTVWSKRGTTSVLGTSFNIYTRNEDYAVTCYTGKVNVTSRIIGENIILKPNQQASMRSDGSLAFVENIDTRSINAWQSNMFVFTGLPILKVIQEIERQYNVRIEFKANINLTYSGNFSKSLPINEVLDLVSTSLGYKFEAVSGNAFLIR